MSRQPVLFVSHGAPTFALEPGRAGALLQALGERMGGEIHALQLETFTPDELATQAH